MEFKKLNDLVIDWAEQKGILEKGNPLAQIEKTKEEVEETILALMHQSLGSKTFVTEKGNVAFVEDEIKDGFGDILVTVLIGCKMQNINPLDALETAYNVISKRQGKMIGGQFVKN